MSKTTDKVKEGAKASAPGIFLIVIIFVALVFLAPWIGGGKTNSVDKFLDETTCTVISSTC